VLKTRQTKRASGKHREENREGDEVQVTNHRGWAETSVVRQAKSLPRNTIQGGVGRERAQQAAGRREGSKERKCGRWAAKRTQGAITKQEKTAVAEQSIEYL